MTFESYLKEFNEAVDFTNKMGLNLPKDINFNLKKKYFTPEGNSKLLKVYSNIFQSKLNNTSDMTEFSLGMIANCSPFHYFIKKYIDKELKCKSYLTVGYVYFEDSGKDFHKITRDDVKKYLSKKQFPKDHHVWLTLESGEILDLTLPITLSSIHDRNFNKNLMNGEIEINFINRHINDFVNSFAYKPILIGDDFFNKIGFGLESTSQVMYSKYLN